jgi:hypothetical protein
MYEERIIALVDNLSLKISLLPNVPILDITQLAYKKK